MAAGKTAMYCNNSDLSSVAQLINPIEYLTENSCYLYVDIDMTTTKNNGYYSDGTYWYRVTGNNGRITEAGACSDL